MSATLPGRLLTEVTCPNCWLRFSPEKVLFVARHDALLGDSVVGSDAFRRFLPMRFTIEGDALDSHGQVCTQLACPRCHLELPRAHIEMPPLFFSIVGVPASGKSYFLAAMSHGLRTHAGRLGFVFSDTDPVGNAKLHLYEDQLFYNANMDRPVELPKTQQADPTLVRTVVVNGQTQTFPRPFQFQVMPLDSNSPQAQKLYPFRSLVLYDNAGESFLPGADTAASPVTLHLAEAQALMFVFDPTQDPKFRRRLTSEDPQLKHGSRPGSEGTLARQEIILQEMASRVRRYRGLGATGTHSAPLIMVLAKADLWCSLIDDDLKREPILEGTPAKLDLSTIRLVSAKCRMLMQQTCPEIVTTAEAFCAQVFYVPISSMGTSPMLVNEGGRDFYGIKPRDMQSRWATVPALLALSQTVSGLIETK